MNTSPNPTTSDRSFAPPTPPMREIFDPLQPIDLLSYAKQAGRKPDARFVAAVNDLQNLYMNRSLSPRPKPSAVSLADVPAHDVDWLWPGRVPIGKVTLLVGDPGVGKSLLALDIAAHVTTGSPWPDTPAACGLAPNPQSATNPGEGQRQGDKEKGRQGDSCTIRVRLEAERSLSPCLPLSLSSPPANPDAKAIDSQPGTVLLLSAEDDLADTIRPRLEALGADCTRIITVVPEVAGHETSATNNAGAAASSSDVRGSIHHPPPRELDLGRDVAFLERVLDDHPECRLVIVDPISAYLGRAVENINTEVRRIISPLARLAARRRLALVLISHLRKQSGKAVHSSLGSLAYVAAARTAWLVTKDRHDPHRRLLLPIKNNIAADSQGLACTIEPHPSAGLPIVRWSQEPIDRDADEALTALGRSAGRPAADRDEAARWLKTQLTDGPRSADEIKELADAHGFAPGTLRRAFRHLGGEAVKTGFGTTGQWLWRLSAKMR